MLNRNSCLLKYLCLPLLFLVGCSSLNQKGNKEIGVDNRLLEKRINDLSGKISLVVNDANIIHNEMEDVKTFTESMQQKIERLEAMVSNLNERIVSLTNPAKTSDFAKTPDEETDVEPPLTIASSKASEVPESDILKTEVTESPLAVVNNSCDAGNTKDMQKDFEETTQPEESKPDVAPPQQETSVISEKSEQTETEGTQKDTEEMTRTDEAEPDIAAPKQETTVSSEISEQTKRELFVKENIVRLAEAEFPDTKGIQWNIISFEHKAHLSKVEVEPTPATVGYPRLKFVISFKNPEMPNIIGLFCFKDGQYSLLDTKKK
ncbi:MAG: hypothetical protein HUU08_09110 [Candidatus Brocadia sp.]|nr:hypothetical protein [Candidatus Brocadia sp.]